MATWSFKANRISRKHTLTACDGIDLSAIIKNSCYATAAGPFQWQQLLFSNLLFVQSRAELFIVARSNFTALQSL